MLNLQIVKNHTPSYVASMLMYQKQLLAVQQVNCPTLELQRKTYILTCKRAILTYEDTNDDVGF